MFPQKGQHARRSNFVGCLCRESVCIGNVVFPVDVHAPLMSYPWV